MRPRYLAEAARLNKALTTFDNTRRRLPGIQNPHAAGKLKAESNRWHKTRGARGDSKPKPA